MTDKVKVIHIIHIPVMLQNRKVNTGFFKRFRYFAFPF